MPAGVAFAPRGRPLHDMGRLVGEPQNKVGRVLLAGIDIDILPRSGELCAEVQAGQLAVIGIFGGVEINAFACLIGIAQFLEPLDQGRSFQGHGL